jgi:hypothetical protein
MPTAVSAIARHAVLVVVLPLAVVGGGCRAGARSVPVVVVDLLKEFDRADRRPAGAFVVAERGAAGLVLPAIAGPAPGRLTWTLPLPRHGTFRTRVAASAAAIRVRIGISDARIYEQLAQVDVAPDTRWTDISVDLSAYAGWKLSLFYRPERQAWRLNLSADAVAGTPANVAWGVPEIVAPGGADAIEYARRRARITRSGAP